jgi:ribonuclease Z
MESRTARTTQFDIATLRASIHYITLRNRYQPYCFLGDENPPFRYNLPSDFQLAGRNRSPRVLEVRNQDHTDALRKKVEIMGITSEVLGEPGCDNALLVTVDSGQSLHRLLFDCGEGCLATVPVCQIQAIEAVFFSHFHIDHVAGFDALLRRNWARPDAPVRIFGPPGAIQIVQHRLCGYTWNLVTDVPGQWIVTEVADGELRSSRFLTCEGFGTEHPLPASAATGDIVYRGDCFSVHAHRLDHGTPCLAYAVREDDRQNVEPRMLRTLGIPPGPWLKAVKDPEVAADSPVHVAGQDYPVGDLRRRLLTSSPGDSIAYVTDFFLATEADEDRLVQFLSGCRTLVCENNYRDADADLARKNYHMTATDVARLARRVGLDKLVLFHVSDRYDRQALHEQLAEVRQHFDRAAFPPQWIIP